MKFQTFSSDSHQRWWKVTSALFTARVWPRSHTHVTPWACGGSDPCFRVTAAACLIFRSQFNSGILSTACHILKTAMTPFPLSVIDVTVEVKIAWFSAAPVGWFYFRAKTAKSVAQFELFKQSDCKCKVVVVYSVTGGDSCCLSCSFGKLELSNQYWSVLFRLTVDMNGVRNLKLQGGINIVYDKYR